MFKLILSLLPLVFIGGLLFYFTGFEGWNGGSLSQGLGPTVLGLGAVGLIFCIPLAFRLLKLTITPRGPSAAQGGEAEDEEASSFDADAALARYLARKAEAGEATPERATPERVAERPPGFPHGDAPPRPVFGRKTG
ncbi:MAG: hypothetical protein IH998_13680 [Proteobacteria bacterium]|jgi:hypothetical protein|nr:hypothetical protein [Pseudomonadota bacterium]